MSATLESAPALSIPDPPEPPCGMAITNVEAHWPINSRPTTFEQTPPRFYPTVKAARRAWEEHLADLRLLATASVPNDTSFAYAECEFTAGLWGSWVLKDETDF